VQAESAEWLARVATRAEPVLSVELVAVVRAVVWAEMAMVARRRPVR